MERGRRGFLKVEKEERRRFWFETGGVEKIFPGGIVMSRGDR